MPMQPLEELVTQSAAALVATVNDLQRRVEELEKAKPVPGVIPLVDFPAWYRHATNSPPWPKDEDGKDIQTPISESQLRRWVARARHFQVDWIVRDGRALKVDSERFVAWIRRPDTKARVKKEVRS